MPLAVTFVECEQAFRDSNKREGEHEKPQKANTREGLERWTLLCLLLLLLEAHESHSCFDSKRLEMLKASRDEWLSGSCYDGTDITRQTLHV